MPANDIKILRNAFFSRPRTPGNPPPALRNAVAARRAAPPNAPPAVGDRATCAANLKKCFNKPFCETLFSTSAGR